MDFSREELKAVLVLGLIAGIIVSFGEVLKLCGGKPWIDTFGVIVLVLTILGMIISVLIHELGHKISARGLGYYTHVEPYYAGQVFGLVLSVATFGWIQFFTPNTSDLEANPQARIHRLRKYENPKQQAMISMSGIIATAVLATLLHGAFLFSGGPDAMNATQATCVNGTLADMDHSGVLVNVLRNVLMGNIWIMIYSLIPFELLSLYLLRVQQTIEQLPESDGLYILHYSLIGYVFAASFVIVLSLFLAFTTIIGLWFALFFALFTAGWVWVRFFLDANR